MGYGEKEATGGQLRTIPDCDHSESMPGEVWSLSYELEAVVIFPLNLMLFGARLQRRSSVSAYEQN